MQASKRNCASYITGKLQITGGFTAEDVRKDKEGLQTMRNLARNIVFMVNAIADAKEKYGLPEVERGSFTSFPDGK
ncbi:MAG: hypothetical protein II871_02565 [Clostridia bacterium]|nr:hypothetical protein [Clostridia bacterium]